jgi:hypothetical protein
LFREQRASAGAGRKDLHGFQWLGTREAEDFPEDGFGYEVAKPLR